MLKYSSVPSNELLLPMHFRDRNSCHEQVELRLPKYTTKTSSCTYHVMKLMNNLGSTQVEKQ